MAIKEFFIKNIETRERQFDPALQTVYFTNNYNQVKTAVLEYADKTGYTVKNVNDTFHEIFLEHKNHVMIVTIVEINPRETAVDFKVSMETWFGLYRPKKIIIQGISQLKQTLKFKGKGLNK